MTTTAFYGTFSMFDVVIEGKRPVLPEFHNSQTDEETILSSPLKDPGFPDEVEDMDTTDFYTNFQDYMHPSDFSIETLDRPVQRNSSLYSLETLQDLFPDKEQFQANCRDFLRTDDATRLHHFVTPQVLVINLFVVISDLTLALSRHQRKYLHSHTLLATSHHFVFETHEQASWATAYLEKRCRGFHTIHHLTIAKNSLTRDVYVTVQPGILLAIQPQK